MKNNIHLENTGEFVPPGHFYSVVPSHEARREYCASNNSPVPFDLDGINLNRAGQLRLLSLLKPYFEQCPFPDEAESGWRYHFLNPAYSYGDALTLNAIVRHFVPRRIIEIGSGYSSAAILDTNDKFFGGRIVLTCIEPYPELLNSLLINQKSNNVSVIATGVQRVDSGVFKQLRENDILFVDSTHVSKLGSDVNFIIFDVLPALNPGVLVHFHDVFWPFEYPKDWVREGRSWNELYLLRAFLAFNRTFEVLFFTDYLWKTSNEILLSSSPKFKLNSGGNFWMRKLS